MNIFKRNPYTSAMALMIGLLLLAIAVSTYLTLNAPEAHIRLFAMCLLGSQLLLLLYMSRWFKRCRDTDKRLYPKEPGVWGQ